MDEDDREEIKTLRSLLGANAIIKLKDVPTEVIQSAILNSVQLCVEKWPFMKGVIQLGITRIDSQEGDRTTKATYDPETKIISLNIEQFSNIEKLEKLIKKYDEENLIPSGTGDVSSIMTHELGHVLSKVLEEQGIFVLNIISSATHQVFSLNFNELTDIELVSFARENASRLTGQRTREIIEIFYYRFSESSFFNNRTFEQHNEFLTAISEEIFAETVREYLHSNTPGEFSAVIGKYIENYFKET